VTGSLVEARLWWKQFMQSSRRGGSRDPDYLRGNLVIGPTNHPKLPVVIVDDVCTSGGHLRATEATLRGSGSPVLFAACAGRTSEFEPDEAFKIEWTTYDLLS
jgi:adenine/guanine phosphoribosyltransferase-like PRPP-binding protein